MTKYSDPFGRETIIEVNYSEYFESINFVIRKERQAIYESWSLDVAKEFLVNLQKEIDKLEENNVSK